MLALADPRSLGCGVVCRFAYIRMCEGRVSVKGAGARVGAGWYSAAVCESMGKHRHVLHCVAAGLCVLSFYDLFRAG
jgi:hypothetical protein